MPQADDAPDTPGDDATATGPRRWTTADLVGPTLIFVGAFLVAVTIALPTLVVDRLRAIPLSTDITTVATAGVDAPGTTPSPRPVILDRCSLATPTARTVEATLVRQQRMVAVRPADAHRVTLQAGTSVQADRLWLDGREVDPDTPRPGSEVPPAAGASACTAATLSATKDRVTLDRSSALPDLSATGDGSRGNSEIQYDSNRPPIQVPDRRGYTYVLPFDPPRSGARFFDVTTRRTVDLVDHGETSLAGRTAIRYTADIPDTDLDAIGSGTPDGTPPTRIVRPASWFGVGGVDPTRQVTATLHHAAQWQITVDATTGTILDERISVEQTYRSADPALATLALTNLRADFGYDLPTQRSLAQRASDRATPVVIWGRLVPLLAGILGALALIAGVTLTVPGGWRRMWPLRRRHDREPAAPPSS